MYVDIAFFITLMYGDTLSFYYAVAKCWVRTAIKLSSFEVIHMEFRMNALIRRFSPVPAAAYFYDGTTGKRSWRIWEVLERSSWNMTSLGPLIQWTRSLARRKAAERIEFESFGRLSAYTQEHFISLKFNNMGSRWVELTTCIYETRISTSGYGSLSIYRSSHAAAWAMRLGTSFK